MCRRVKSGLKAKKLSFLTSSMRWGRSNKSHRHEELVSKSNREHQPVLVNCWRNSNSVNNNHVWSATGSECSWEGSRNIGSTSKISMSESRQCRLIQPALCHKRFHPTHICLKKHLFINLALQFWNLGWEIRHSFCRRLYLEDFCFLFYGTLSFWSFWVFSHSSLTISTIIWWSLNSSKQISSEFPTHFYWSIFSERFGVVIWLLLAWFLLWLRRWWGELWLFLNNKFD